MYAQPILQGGGAKGWVASFPGSTVQARPGYETRYMYDAVYVELQLCTCLFRYLTHIYPGVNMGLTV